MFETLDTAELPTILNDLGYTGVITYEISPLRYSLTEILTHIAAEASR
jgi:hypothetical protein